MLTLTTRALTQRRYAGMLTDSLHSRERGTGGRGEPKGGEGKATASAVEEDDRRIDGESG
jgi:hypothetical protein